MDMQYINFWQQLAELKSSLLDVAGHLKEDPCADREKSSNRLLEISKHLHELENECLSAMRKSEEI